MSAEGLWPACAGRSFPKRADRAITAKALPDLDGDDRQHRGHSHNCGHSAQLSTSQHTIAIAETANTERVEEVSHLDGDDGEDGGHAHDGGHDPQLERDHHEHQPELQGTVHEERPEGGRVVEPTDVCGGFIGMRGRGKGAACEG
jgi:hypothetical protein